MPSLTFTLRNKFQKPPLSLKQFMLRSEVLKLYRGFMRLGRLMDTPSPPSVSALNDTSENSSKTSNSRNLHPLQVEWQSWVRSEFRLRQQTTEEELIRMMLTHGKRQLQEMERTILIATNRNSPPSTTKPDAGCTTKVQDNANKIS